METSNNGSTISQPSSACVKMREFIEAIHDYTKTRSDSSALLINNFLQAYSVTIDVTAFDPDSTLGSQFYGSLYELFSNVDPHSKMAWSCVRVLCNACRNSSARQFLINTYLFVPALSRMLEDQLSTSKKKELLVLLQDLTCGIKLSWQVSHLPHLLKTLTKWVEEKNQDIVCLSLSVLVNLCFKNLSAVYTLSRIVDIKKFLRFCLPLQGPLIEIHVCKLMIIFDHLNDDIPRNTLLNLVTPTFKSMEESLSKNDPVILRSTVDFFVDMVSDENQEVFKHYDSYCKKLDSLIQIIMARKSSDPDATPLPQCDPECVNLILKFIYTLEINKLADLSELHTNILKLAVDWVDSEKVACQAYNLLTTITQNLSETDDNKRILNILGSKLPTFLSKLQSESTPVNMDGCKRLGSLLQLLRMMLKSNSISDSVLKAATEPLVMNVFSSILSDEQNFNLPRLKVNEDNTTSTEYVDAYVCAVSFVYELAQQDARWLEMLSMLMENRNIHSLLALALSGSNHKMKQLVLELSKYSRFPIAKVANIMESRQNMFYQSEYTFNKQQNSALSLNSVYPVLGYTQMEMLDDTLGNFKRLVQEQTISNISVNQVMELYEYKLASLSASELSATNSLKAASERCVYLQNRIVQLSSEYNKLQQLIHHSETKLEKSERCMNDLRNFWLEEKRKADMEIEKCQKSVSEFQERIKELETELTQAKEEKRASEEQITKFQNVIQKLEENGNRVEKQLVTREQQLKNANSHIDGLNAQIKDLRKTLEQKQAKLSDITKQYVAKKELLDTITKMATSQMN